MLDGYVDKIGVRIHIAQRVNLSAFIVAPRLSCTCFGFKANGYIQQVSVVANMLFVIRAFVARSMADDQLRRQFETSHKFNGMFPMPLRG